MNETTSTTKIDYLDVRWEPSLERAELWDLEGGVVMPPVKRPRAVVSVAFQREEFERVCEEAERRGMKVSAYIRERALG